MKKHLLVVLLAALSSCLFGGVSHAQYPPPCDVLEVDTTMHVAGNDVDLYVCGARYPTMLEVRVNGTGVELTVPARADGRIVVPLPPDLTPGVYTVSVNGTAADGNPLELNMPISVVSPGSPEAKLVEATKSAAAVSALTGSGPKTQVKGIQIPNTAAGPATVALRAAPAAFKGAGIGLLGLLGLATLGAVGFAGFSRVRR